MIYFCRDEQWGGVTFKAINIICWYIILLFNFVRVSVQYVIQATFVLLYELNNKRNLFFNFCSDFSQPDGPCREGGHWKLWAVKGAGHRRWVKLSLHWKEHDSHTIVCMPVIPVISAQVFALRRTLLSGFVYFNHQPMAKCSWWGKWVVMMQESCMPWRFWRRLLLYKRQRLLSTHGQSGRCWSTSASLHSSSHFTMPSRQIPSCTSFSVRYFHISISVLCL